MFSVFEENCMDNNKYANYIVAVDLDDTLLTTNKEVSNYTLDVLNRCKENGFSIAISSTRGYSTCYRIADLISADYICCQSGNMIVDKNKTVIYKNSFDQTDVAELIDYFSKYTQDIIIDSDFDLIGHTTQAFADKWGALLCDLATLKTIPAYKLCVGFEDSYRSIIEKYCEEKGFVYRKMIDADYMFITPANSNKYYALQQLMKILDSSPDKLVVFGDDDSDLLSIENAGFGVAMANSKIHVLNAAKFTTDSNDEDGVAKFLEKQFLI